MSRSADRVRAAATLRGEVVQRAASHASALGWSPTGVTTGRSVAVPDVRHSADEGTVPALYCWPSRRSGFGADGGSAPPSRRRTRSRPVASSPCPSPMHRPDVLTYCHRTDQLVHSRRRGAEGVDEDDPFHGACALICGAAGSTSAVPSSDAHRPARRRAHEGGGCAARVDARRRSGDGPATSPAPLPRAPACLPHGNPGTHRRGRARSSTPPMQSGVASGRGRTPGPSRGHRCWPGVPRLVRCPVGAGATRARALTRVPQTSSETRPSRPRIPEGCRGRWTRNPKRA